MFRTYLPPIIRSLDTVHTAIGICHTDYVDSLLVIVFMLTVASRQST